MHFSVSEILLATDIRYIWRSANVLFSFVRKNSTVQKQTNQTKKQRKGDVGEANLQ